MRSVNVFVFFFIHCASATAIIPLMAKVYGLKHDVLKLLDFLVLMHR